MARKPREFWSDAYRRRVERGEARGLSRQQARGHVQREFATRVERAVAAGRNAPLSSQDYRFLRQQEGRTNNEYQTVFGVSVMRRSREIRTSAARELYERLTPEQRSFVRHKQAAMAARYQKAQRERRQAMRRAGRVERRELNRNFGRGDYRDPEFYDTLLDIDADLPDIDEDDDALRTLLFYH